MIPMIVDAHAPVLPNDRTEDVNVDEIIRCCCGAYFDHLVYRRDSQTFVVVKAMANHHNSPVLYLTLIRLNNGWYLIDTLTSWARTKYFGRVGFDQGDILACAEYDKFITRYRESKYDRMAMACVKFAKNENIITRLPEELQVLIEKFIIPLTNTSFQAIRPPHN
jgi:hypothetical protein